VLKLNKENDNGGNDGSIGDESTKEAWYLQLEGLKQYLVVIKIHN
jgi:hypothetical protein